MSEQRAACCMLCVTMTIVKSCLAALRPAARCGWWRSGRAAKSARPAGSASGLGHCRARCLERCATGAGGPGALLLVELLLHFVQGAPLAQAYSSTRSPCPPSTVLVVADQASTTLPLSLIERQEQHRLLEHRADLAAQAVQAGYFGSRCYRRQDTFPWPSRKRVDRIDAV